MKIFVFVFILFVLSQDYPTQRPIKESQATFSKPTSEPSTITHTKLNEFKEKPSHFKENIIDMPKRAKKSIMDQMKAMENFFKSRFWPFKEKSLAPSLIEDLEDYMTSWEPRAEMYETKDRIKLRVELPGITKEDVKIELKTTPDNQRDILHIHGKRKKEQISSDEKHFYKEIFYGGKLFFSSFLDFCRSWTFGKYRIHGLPNAKLENGVLTIEMLKRDIEESKPVVQEIPIKS